MNAKRRNVLKSVKEQLEKLQEIIESEIDDEQASFDNLPDGIQMSSRGEAMEDAISAMQSTVDLLYEACDEIKEAIK